MTASSRSYAFVIVIIRASAQTCHGQSRTPSRTILETMATSKMKLEKRAKGSKYTERWRVVMYGAFEYRRYGTINSNVRYATRCRLLTPVQVNSTSLSNISGSRSGLIYGSVVSVCQREPRKYYIVNRRDRASKMKAEGRSGKRKSLATSKRCK